GRTFWAIIRCTSSTVNATAPYPMRWTTGLIAKGDAEMRMGATIAISITSARALVKHGIHSLPLRLTIRESAVSKGHEIQPFSRSVSGYRIGGRQKRSRGRLTADIQ